MVKMKKIIIITRSMDAGGAERVIAQLANYMVENEIQPTIVMLNNKEVFYNINRKINIIPIGKKSNKIYIDKILKYKEVRRIVNLEKPDIVLALPEEIGIFVIPALLGKRVPIVVSERNNPWVMPHKKITRLCRILFYPFADGFVFQTNQAASFFPKNIRKKSIVLPNPLDVDRIPKQWKKKRKKQVVGVGRLEKQKNFPLLINAFLLFYKKHNDYTLTIYGEGSLKDELQKLAASLLPHESYSFPGKSNDLLNIINSSSMFVLSSDYEGMPNAVIEAMAMGMPVISTDCPSGGPRELINSEENGILIPVGDVNALYKAMCDIAEDQQYEKMLGENAMLIKEKLDSYIISEKWKVYLERVISKKRTNKRTFRE